MKKIILFIAIICLIFTSFLISCDNSGSDKVVNDAKSLGSSLVLTGPVEQTFVTSTKTLNATYTNPASLDFRLYDEEDNTTYGTDDNAGEDVNVDFDYDGITPDILLSVYSSSLWTGLSSSNPAADITTAVIDIDTTSDDIVYGNFDGLPAEWYYYMYSTAETIMDGTFVDTSDDTNHIFDNIRIFEGWNRMRKITSDGETYTYTGGDITDGHWTYMEN